MKRSVPAALAVALVLIMSVGGVAAAAGEDARSSAGKAAKGKKKRCKAKGEKKKGCKKKGKKARASWPLNGHYEGREGIALDVAARGKKAELVYSPTNAKTCIEHSAIGLPATTVTPGGASFEAAGEGTLPNGQYSWSITVKRDLTYRATISSSAANPFYGPCDRPGAVFTGKLKEAR